jgi:hypothetical protein
MKMAVRRLFPIGKRWESLWPGQLQAVLDGAAAKSLNTGASWRPICIRWRLEFQNLGDFSNKIVKLNVKAAQLNLFTKSHIT